MLDDVRASDIQFVLGKGLQIFQDSDSELVKLLSEQYRAQMIQWGQVPARGHFYRCSIIHNDWCWGFSSQPALKCSRDSWVKGVA